LRREIIGLAGRLIQITADCAGMPVAGVAIAALLAAPYFATGGAILLSVAARADEDAILF
jgi:hypothetical protein